MTARNMKTALLAPVLVIFCSMSYAQQGQGNKRVEIFAGYSSQKIETEQFEEFSRFAGLTRPQIQTNFNASADQLHQGFDDSYRAARRLDGINASVTYYLRGGLGITGDFAYHSKNGSHSTPSNPIFFEDFTRSRRRSFTILAGPQLKFHRQSRLQPFVHLVAGVVKQDNRSSQFFNNPSGSGQAIETRRLEDNFTAFTAGGGGGLDLAVKQNWAIRLIQVDHLVSFTGSRAAALTANHVSLGQTSFENSHRENLRLSFGVVFRW
jgi:opacity protein-like surface antigen